MAISKLILNGEVQMDVTSNTNVAGNMLSGIIGTKNDGTSVTGNIVSKSSSNLTVSGATVTAPAGYYANAASKAVASGTAGTPTATKGTVNNHSISVTPSVTNTTGYITGSTKTGTAVTVSASELVSGTKSITENGTSIDVTNYASVDVAVSSGPTHTVTITQAGSSNGVYFSYNNVIYSSVGSISVNENDTIKIKVTRGDSNYLYINNVQIAGGYMQGVSYDYTVTTDIEISFTPGTGVSTAYVTEISDIEALTVTQNGTYTASGSTRGYSPVIVSVSGGGGGEAALKKQINFIDYDGTILHSYTKTEWQSVSTLPSNPSHSGLTSQGWNWTKAQIDAQLTACPDSDVWVGQMYITNDGKTRIYIHLEEGRLHPYLGFGPDGTVVIDWGDNSATVTISGASLTTVQHASHTYASEGDYMITITVSSGSFAFYGVTNTSHILKKNTTTSTNIHNVYTNAIQKIELGTGANIGNHAFSRCCSLASITIPSGVTSIGTYAFRGCYSLASITIPSGVTSIGNNTFYACYSLVSITIPSGVTSIGDSAFDNCLSLASITIPSGVTSIGTSALYACYSLGNITIPSGVTSIDNSAFHSCQSLASITIPSGVTSIGSSVFYNCYSLVSITIPIEVTSIGDYAFSYCYGMAEYHIKPTTVPTLGATAFNYIQSDCVIYVPSASLDAYKTANNWSTYASYMQGE